MFGYVVANFDKLNDDEKQQYRACYCGLCRALGKRHGTISRISLTYDMTFLVLVLSSVYNVDNKIETEKCMIHPLKKHQYWQNKITNYAADMNVLLAYHNFIDDWKDDRKLLSLCEAKLFEKGYNKVAVKYPRQSSTISECLRGLSNIEKKGEINADIPANCFGYLMGEIFVIEEDDYAERLRAFGKCLGKFIYIMDACLDLKADIKKERYNPFVSMSNVGLSTCSGNLSPEDFSDILNLLMADCTEKYKLLPINNNKNLIENILYSGVWTKYEAEKNKTKEANK